MPEENLEVVRRALAAWQSDDLDGFLAEIDPEVVWHAAFERLVGGMDNSYRGIEGMREFWDAYRTELEDFRFEPEDFRLLGDDCVVLLGHARFRGRASGVEVDSESGLVITLRDGKIIRSVDYMSQAEALEAAGVSDQQS
jgi:ketosteroid isomerase-like protein